MGFFTFIILFSFISTNINADPPPVQQGTKTQIQKTVKRTKTVVKLQNRNPDSYRNEDTTPVNTEPAASVQSEPAASIQSGGNAGGEQPKDVFPPAWQMRGKVDIPEYEMRKDLFTEDEVNERVEQEITQCKGEYNALKEKYEALKVECQKSGKVIIEPSVGNGQNTSNKTKILVVIIVILLIAIVGVVFSIFYGKKKDDKSKTGSNQTTNDMDNRGRMDRSKEVSHYDGGIPPRRSSLMDYKVINDGNSRSISGNKNTINNDRFGQSTLKRIDYQGNINSNITSNNINANNGNRSKSPELWTPKRTQLNVPRKKSLSTRLPVM